MIPFVWSRRCVVALFGVAVAACLTLPAAALAASNLQVSPTIIELSGVAGQRLTQPITVTANDEPLTVELVHADFGFDDTSYQVTLIRDDAPETTAFSTRGWFSLPKERYTIKAHSSAELPLSVSIPRNTPGGTYLGAALLRVVPAAAKPGTSQVQAVPEAGPLLFIAVEGGDPPKAELSRFEVPGLVSHGPIRPKLRITNRGDEYFTYEGTVTMTGPGHDQQLVVPRKYVVPGEPRDIQMSAKDDEELAPLRFDRRKLGFGKYTVKTRLRIEPTGTTLVSTRTVWVIPTWLRIVAVAVAVLFAACLALLIGWLVQRRRTARFLDEPADDELDQDDLDADYDEESL